MGPRRLWRTAPGRKSPERDLVSARLASLDLVHALGARVADSRPPGAGRDRRLALARIQGLGRFAGPGGRLRVRDLTAASWDTPTRATTRTSGPLPGIPGSSPPCCSGCEKGHRWAWTVVPPLALCLLSGHPQEGYFLLLTLGIWVLAMARATVSRRAAAPASDPSAHLVRDRWPCAWDVRSLTGCQP